MPFNYSAVKQLTYITKPSFYNSVNHHTGKEYYLINQYFHDIKLHKIQIRNMLKHLE